MASVEDGEAARSAAPSDPVLSVQPSVRFLGEYPASREYGSVVGDDPGDNSSSSGRTYPGAVDLFPLCSKWSGWDTTAR
ncbi:hypothetical protein D3C76_1723870 [compost metagenome]